MHSHSPGLASNSEHEIKNSGKAGTMSPMIQQWILLNLFNLHVHVYCLRLYCLTSLLFCEFIMCVLAGDSVGFFSAPLKEIAAMESSSHNDDNEWKWIDLFPPESKVLFTYLYIFPSQPKFPCPEVL